MILPFFLLQVRFNFSRPDGGRISSTLGQGFQRQQIEVLTAAPSTSFLCIARDINFSPTSSLGLLYYQIRFAFLVLFYQIGHPLCLRFQGCHLPDRQIAAGSVQSMMHDMINYQTTLGLPVYIYQIQEYSHLSYVSFQAAVRQSVHQT